MSTSTMSINSEDFQLGPLVLKISSYVMATLITIVITMFGFWMVEGREYVTKAEVKEIITDENKVIMELLSHQKSTEIRIEAVLEKNTEAIQQLRLQLNTLNNTLEFLRDGSLPKNNKNPQ